MTITVFTAFVRMSSYCICCLYPHGLHSLLDLEIKLSIYFHNTDWQFEMFKRGKYDGHDTIPLFSITYVVVTHLDGP